MNWKEIWQRRKETLQTIDMNNKTEILQEMMRLDGYDLSNISSGGGDWI